MRIFYIVSSLALALTLGTSRDAFAQATASASRTATERELRRLEDDWARALTRRDASFFRRTLHPAYVYSDERGVFTKEQVIAEQTAPSDTVTFAANEEMRVHLHGNAAVVTGILVVRGRGKDGPFQHRYRYTDVWARSDGRWRMVASQDYDIPAK
jgi:ketosteroid isomerase-like protein